MEAKLSRLLEDVGILIRTESVLNGTYYDKQKTPLLLRLRTCNRHSPKIKQIAHKGPLKILAFSDYRTQKIEELLNFLSRLEEKPDLIIYAGDDIDRFAPLPEELLSFHFSDNDAQELERVWVSNGWGRYSSPLYGFILRLPKLVASENMARGRILEVVRFVDAIHEKWRENKILSEKDLEEILLEYPTFRFRQGISELGRLKIDILDSSWGTVIISLFKTIPKGFTLDFFSNYFILYRLIRRNESPFLLTKKIREDHDFAYFYILPDEKKCNIFEELASYAKYGLVAIIGNDDAPADRFRIYGRNVYEIHDTWIEIGPFLIIGLEGSTCGLGPSGDYGEGSVRLRLELAFEISRDKKLLIVSHSPPRGVLDRAMRFGDEAIGSLALRDFLEENNNVALVICGHVHKCGGKCERINNTVVVNVSSHDDAFSKANMVWILLDQTGNAAEIKWFKLPSLIETILREYSGEEKLLHLREEAGLSRNEATLLTEAHEKYGNKLIDDIQDMANLKFRYGFSWDNIIKFYRYGVKAPEHITQSLYETVLKESCGINKLHLQRAYRKLLSEREKDKIYLISPIPLPDHSHIVIFDTEYSLTDGVLYGFLDMESHEFKQFWFDEKVQAKKYLQNKDDKIFVHWGGADRSLLQRDLGCRARTLNLLYYVQTSLVAPISSATLHEVHDVLYGTLERDEFWKRSFYDKNGFDKLILCNRILKEPNDAEAREELAATNKADILALQHIIEKLMQHKIGVRLYPCKVDKHDSIKKIVHPIMNKDMFNDIIRRLYDSMIKRMKREQKYKIEKLMANGLPRRERGFLTLFKVLRKASIFSRQGDIKRSRFYLGLVKREWNFLCDEVPEDLRIKIEGLVENLRSTDADKTIEKIETDLRQTIIEYLEKNLGSDDFLSRFKSAISEQDELLERRALRKKLK
jgi:Icc-related predicted phosphoesterase